MKNKMKILGIIALVALVGLTMTACVRGGTIEVTNGSYYNTADIYAYSGSYSSSTLLTDLLLAKHAYNVSARGKASFTFTEDGTYTVVIDWGNYANPKYATVTLEGGGTVSRTINPF